MSPTSQRDIERLAEFCKQRIGDSLRWVGIVDDGEIDTVYFRGTTKQQYNTQRLLELGDALQEFGEQFNQLYTYSTPLGQKEAVILSFQNAHMFLFSVSGDRTIILSVDRHVGSDLSKFIEQCRNELFKQSPTIPTD